MFSPTLDVVVANPEMLSPRRVVVPKPVLAIDICDGDDVPNPVSGDEVPIESEALSVLKDQMFAPPSESANCGAVDEASCSKKRGVDVPIPVQLFKIMLESVVVVEMSEPIVKLFEVVAIKFAPVASDTKIELFGYEVCPVPPPVTGTVPVRLESDRHAVPIA